MSLVAKLYFLGNRLNKTPSGVCIVVSDGLRLLEAAQADFERMGNSARNACAKIDGYMEHGSAFDGRWA